MTKSQPLKWIRRVIFVRAREVQSSPYGRSVGVPSARRLPFRRGLVFAVLSAALLFAYCFPYQDGGIVDYYLTQYLRGYAYLAATTVKLFDPTAHASGQRIVGVFSMQLVRDCDAMETNILYFAAVCAYPARWRKRAIGWIVGIGVIGLSNVVRLCILYIVGMKFGSAFDFAHDLAPPFIMLISLAIFSVWVAWAQGRDNATA